MSRNVKYKYILVNEVCKDIGMMLYSKWTHWTLNYFWILKYIERILLLLCT